MSENKSKFPSRPKILAVSLAGVLIALPAYAADNPPAEVTESSNIEALTVTGKRSADQKGADDVYYKNVSNAYVGKEYLERYRVQSAGDVLKGLNGVYNMNTRTAGGAITPNIRGITGKGRIPVTIDGTEQTIDVWMNNYGVGDRNYLDPALFRSIAVEKSPALTRGVKSGVGGAMSIRTIEPADIIPEGKNWGIEVKTEFSGNTVAQKNDLRQFLGRDYRTLSPIGATADGTGGSYDANSILSGKPSPTSLRLDPGIADTKYAGGKSHTNFKDDRQLMLSAAFKTDITDGLAAYSHRKKGNYYAGKRGYQSYLNNPIYGADACYDQYPDKSQREKDILCKSSASLVPNMAVLFRPGEEIMNSHTDTKTLLLKNNWYLPDNQKISLQYMDNKIGFGEINPLITAWILGFAEQSLDEPAQQAPGIGTKIDSKTYKIGYEWKPEGSRWIDLNASLWATRTRSKTNSSGGVPGDIAWMDNPWGEAYDNWRNGLRRNRTGLDEGLPNTDGRFNTRQAQALYATNNRNGFNFSNRMKLRDNLELTVLGDFQNEKLATRNEFADLYGDHFKKEIGEDSLYPNPFLDVITYPRNGRRREYNLGFNFRFEPRPWLTLTAGARYTNFSLQDDSVKKFLDNGGELEAHRGLRYTADVVATKKDYEAYQKANAILDNCGELINCGLPEAQYNKLVDDRDKIRIVNDIAMYSRIGNTTPYQARFDWTKDQYGNLNMADHPILSNPKTLTRVENPAYDPADPNSPRFVNKFQNLTAEIASNYTYKSALTPAQKQQAQKQKGSGWAPAASVTFNLTDYARAYLRYTQTLRFPSIFEGTAGVPISPRVNTTSVNRYGYQWKPERGKNFEVGYIHDLTGLFPKMRKADFRINYFRNTTKNIIDRNDQLEFEQFDKQIRTGAELSARFDTGKVYGSLGVIRTIRNDVCDEGAAFTDNAQSEVLALYVQSSGSKPLVRAPTCFPGGVEIKGYLSSMMQPRWSVDAELGARFLKNKLDVGTRFQPHRLTKALDHHKPPLK